MLWVTYQVATLPANTTSYRVSELTGCTDYYLDVYSVHDGGLSDASEWEVVTPCSASSRIVQRCRSRGVQSSARKFLRARTPKGRGIPNGAEFRTARSPIRREVPRLGLLAWWIAPSGVIHAI